MKRGKSGKTVLSVAGAALLAVFFLAYAYLPRTAPHLFNSPDEMSNHYFSTLFSDSGELWRFESINLYADGRMHPRSVRVVDLFLVPGGFIGMPVLFGSIAKVFGDGIIVYLTPLFSLLAVIAWGALVGAIFSAGGKPDGKTMFTPEGLKVGLVASLLLLSNPAWWYTTARTMMPNVLFVSLLLIGATAYLVRPVNSVFRRKGGDASSRLRILDFVIAGVCLSFAVAVRPSELPWLLMSAAVVGVIYRKTIPVLGSVITAVSGAVTAAPLLLLHYSAYGSVFSSGYGEALGSIPAEIASGGLGMRLLGPLQPYLFPLGFAPHTALQNFFTYGVGFFWWWSAAVIVGAVVLLTHRDGVPSRLAPHGHLVNVNGVQPNGGTGSRYRISDSRAGKKEARRSVRALGGVAAVTSVWLILFYGSWIVQDNPDPDAITIGSSYFRYWLPLFVLSTVVVSRAIVVIADRLKGRVRASFVPAVVTVFAMTSAYVVFTSPQEGLFAVRENLIRYEAEISVVLAETEEDALIVVDRADKLLFPARRVMYPLRDDGTYATLGRLKETAPLYYFGITLPEEDVAYLRDVRLAPLGLSLEHVVSFTEESLYRFTPVTEKE